MLLLAPDVGLAKPDSGDLEYPVVIYIESRVQLGLKFQIRLTSIEIF